MDQIPIPDPNVGQLHLNCMVFAVVSLYAVLHGVSIKQTAIGLIRPFKAL